MNLYTISNEGLDEYIRIGDEIEINGAFVVVVAIIEVSFENKTIRFSGSVVRRLTK